MLGHLSLQSRLQNLASQTGQQPTRPGQLDPLRSRSLDQLLCQAIRKIDLLPARIH